MIEGRGSAMDRSVRTLMTAAARASRSLATGAGPDVTAAMDGLRSAATGVQLWAVDHPGPEPDANDRLMVLAARCGFIALMARHGKDGSPHPAVDRLDALHDELAAIVARRQLDSRGSDIA